MSRALVFPETKRSFPCWRSTNTWAGVSAACSDLIAARSRRVGSGVGFGAAVESLASDNSSASMLVRVAARNFRMGGVFMDFGDLNRFVTANHADNANAKQVM